MQCATAVIFFALLGVALAGVFQMDMIKIQSKRAKMIADGTWEKYYESKQRLRARGGKAVASQPVGDWDDLEYIGNGTIGTPQQQFLLILDTGSSNLWLPDSSCNSCRRKHKFDSSKSSTFKADNTQWNIEYGDGSNARGVQGIDTICFGGTGTSQLCVPTTTFGRATSEQGFNQDPTDGILGLAFQSISVNGVVPPLINAINQGLLDKPLFTVYLTRNGLQEGVRGGVFTYGAIDTTNCGNVIAYQPLSSASYWQFRIAGLSLGSYSSSNTAEVISDTGTSLIGGPRGVTDGLAAAAGATYNNQQGVYTMPCNASPPDLVFNIGSNKYNIKKANYIIDLGFGGGTCAFGVFPFDFGGIGPAWILGDPFIRTYCNIYDIGGQRIGFAPTK